MVCVSNNKASVHFTGIPKCRASPAARQTSNCAHRHVVQAFKSESLPVRERHCSPLYIGQTSSSEHLILHSLRRYIEQPFFHWEVSSHASPQRLLHRLSPLYTIISNHEVLIYALRSSPLSSILPFCLSIGIRNFPHFLSYTPRIAPPKASWAVCVHDLL
jgi:hypothetical protein